jgi:hypothetical protein
MAITNDKGILKDDPPDFFGDRLGNFANESAAETVPGQNKIRESFVEDKIDDGPYALRVRDFLAGPFSVSCHGRSESLVALAFEVPNDVIPSGSVMPGAMH